MQKGFLRVKETFLGDQEVPLHKKYVFWVRRRMLTRSDFTNMLSHQTIIWAPTHAGTW